MIILRKQKYKELPWTKENIEKYKSQENMLKHARNTPGKNGWKIINKPSQR